MLTGGEQTRDWDIQKERSENVKPPDDIMTLDGVMTFDELMKTKFFNGRLMQYICYHFKILNEQMRIENDQALDFDYFLEKIRGDPKDDNYAGMYRAACYWVIFQFWGTPNEEIPNERKLKLTEEQFRLKKESLPYPEFVNNAEKLFKDDSDDEIAYHYNKIADDEGWTKRTLSTAEMIKELVELGKGEIRSEDYENEDITYTDIAYDYMIEKLIDNGKNYKDFGDEDPPYEDIASEYNKIADDKFWIKIENEEEGEVVSADQMRKKLVELGGDYIEYGHLPRPELPDQNSNAKFKIENATAFHKTENAWFKNEIHLNSFWAAWECWREYYRPDKDKKYKLGEKVGESWVEAKGDKLYKDFKLYDPNKHDHKGQFKKFLPKNWEQLKKKKPGKQQ